MTAVEQDVLRSVDPATGEVVGEFPVHGEAEVRAAVDRARTAAEWWAGIGFDGRERKLKAWRKVIAGRLDELLDLLTRENGKVRDDGLVEATVALLHLDWSAKHAKKTLRARKVSSDLLTSYYTGTVEYLPYGVVGVIGPWNYPIFTPMGSIAYALAAGNAVVFKPSELTPAVGRWMVDTFREAVPEQPVLQLVTGYGPTGAALCRSGVDKIAFTGSTATGKKVMAACAETLTPVLMECGGKDALIVDDDADLPKAVDAALWGGMTNAGQTCIGIERVYVVDRVYDEFCARLTEAARGLEAGKDYGPMTMPSQLDVVKRHIDDALARGGRALVGGPESVRPPYVDPVVLVDVPEDSAAVREETFGPTLTVARVADVDEAVAKANAVSYGLGGLVFGKKRAAEVAERLRSGMTAVNAPHAFAAVSALPFGGVGDSGFGRIHGEDGLREFAWAKSIARQRFSPPIDITTYAKAPQAAKRLTALLKQVYTRL